jgi:hypothetical protein
MLVCCYLIHVKEEVCVDKEETENLLLLAVVYHPVLLLIKTKLFGDWVIRLQIKKLCLMLE